MKKFTISRFSAIGVLAAVLVLAWGQSACTYKKVNTDPVPVVTPATCQGAPTVTTVSYQRDVWPILKTKCRDACHNAQTASIYGNFNADVFAQVQYWSTTKPSASHPYSYLIGNVRHASGYVNMPVGGTKLSDCDIALIETWIAANTPNN